MGVATASRAHHLEYYHCFPAPPVSASMPQAFSYSACACSSVGGSSYYFSRGGLHHLASCFALSTFVYLNSMRLQQRQRQSHYPLHTRLPGLDRPQGRRYFSATLSRVAVSTCRDVVSHQSCPCPQRRQLSQQCGASRTQGSASAAQRQVHASATSRSPCSCIWLARVLAPVRPLRSRQLPWPHSQ